MSPMRFSLLAVLFTGIASAQAPTIAGCPSFPANNIWNTPVDTLPVHPLSANYINSISAGGTLRYDVTMPINIVPGTQPQVPITIWAPAESDPGPFPIPPDAEIEPGSDAHTIVVDKD